MKKRIEKLYNEAGEFHARAKSLIDEYEGKDLPSEKQQEIDTLLDQVEAKTAEAKRLERAMQQEQHLGEPQNRLGASTAAGDEKDGQPTLEEKAFRNYLRHGEKALGLMSGDERKALRADEDTAGGFITAPQTFAAGLLKFVDDVLVVRQLATVEQIGAAESLGILTLDTDLSDWDWTTELGTGSEDTVKPFGKRALTPHPLAKRIKISNTLIRRAIRPVEQIVQQLLAYKMGVTLEKAYMTGNGAARPLGMFVASNDGIPTSRDVTATNATSFTGDNLIDMKYSLKQQYQDSKTTRWIVHRDFVKMARKLKDGQNQYLWQPGLGGTPATILDIPVVQSEFAPNTFTASQYVGILGDISFYYIVDALSMQIQVLLELYAETNQRGYIARYEGDGAPQLAEAFARMKLAA